MPMLLASRRCRNYLIFSRHFLICNRSTPRPQAEPTTATFPRPVCALLAVQLQGHHGISLDHLLYISHAFLGTGNGLLQ